MKLIIDISDEDYNVILANANFYKEQHWGIADVWDAIVSGKPLPKGYGTLKDVEKIYADMSEREELARRRVIDCPSNSPCYMRYVTQLNERTAFKEMLFDAPTIIEADKEADNE